MNLCKICNKKAVRRHLCKKHYLFELKIGNKVNGIEPIVRFRKKVKINKKNGCWEWQGYRDRNGYGTFSTKFKMMKAHRFSYEYYNKKIPDNMLVCHTCDNPCCVNPEHLWLGTDCDNHRDMVKKGRFRTVYGEDCGSSKLSNNEVLHIRIFFNKNKNKMTKVKIIRLFSKKHEVSTVTIERILYNSTWKKFIK